MASKTCTVKGWDDIKTAREKSLSPEQRFCNCPDTSTAIVARNADLEGIPACVSKFTKLEKLDVSRNVKNWGTQGISSNVAYFEKSLANLKPVIDRRTLKEIRVRGNGITTIVPLLSFGLESIDAGENRLGWIPNRNNGIWHVGILANSLKELRLDRNDLETISTEWDSGFDANFKNLEVLDLSYNRLDAFAGHVSPSFDKDKIRLIDVSGNCTMSPHVTTNNLDMETLGKVLRADMKHCNNPGQSGIHPKPAA